MAGKNTSKRHFQPVSDWQGFYSIEQMARLARIPKGTLYEWRRRGIIEPSVCLVLDDELILDGYSYADLTIVRMLCAVRNKRLDLKSASLALRHLYERLGPPDKGWLNTTVHFVGNKVFVDKDDEWQITVATGAGQKVETRAFGDWFESLRDQEEEGSILVPKDFTHFVEIDPKIMGGQPVVRGTRVPTSLLAAMKAEGKSIDEIVRLYQPIPKKTIEKAIEYEEYLDGKDSKAA